MVERQGPNRAALELERVSCPSCAADDCRVLSVHQGCTTVHCRRCGLVYQNPRPTPKALAAFYDESYYCSQRKDYGYANYEQNFLRFRDVFERLFEVRRRIFARFVQPGDLLEIGCAHGFQLNWLREKGWRTKGCELSPLAARYAVEQLHLDVFNGDFIDLDLPEGSFDLILMLDVLEHLTDVPAGLAKVRRLLRPGGILYVQCPYELFHWEKAARALLHGRRPSTVAPDALPVHVLFFTPRTLRELLERHGFRIVHRASGNYGAIRNRLTPPPLASPVPGGRILRWLYFRAGLQKLLYRLAVTLKQGTGIIYLVTPADPGH